TSEMTLAEILVGPMKLGDIELATGYENLIASTENFEVLPIRRDVLIEAARLRSQRASIHIVSARALACSCIVSDDRRLAAVDGLKLLPVNPSTLDDILLNRP